MGKKRTHIGKSSKISTPRSEPMTLEKLERIERILQRMNLDLTRSIRICEEFGRDILNEERDQFWALIKYIENVQDGIVQLDNINKTVFPRLLEFPEKSADNTETSWKSLKGMRSRLAHAFNNIDHEIVWSTVTHDFPKLVFLLNVLQFVRLESGAVQINFKAGLWRTLPKAGLVFYPPAEHREPMSGLAIPFSMWQCAGHGDAAGPGFVR